MAIPQIDELQLLHSNICKALGDTRRIQILYALYEEPLNVTSLAERLDCPQPTISRHLALLRGRALVSAERDGASVVYSLAHPAIIHILNSMRDLLRNILEEQSEVMG